MKSNIFKRHLFIKIFFSYLLLRLIFNALFSQAFFFDYRAYIEILVETILFSVVFYYTLKVSKKYKSK